MNYSLIKNGRVEAGKVALTYFDIFAGLEGIEPSSEVLETSVLPLNDRPMNRGDYSNSCATKEMIGEMRAAIGEVPPAIGSNMRMRMIVPY